MNGELDTSSAIKLFLHSEKIKTGLIIVSSVLHQIISGKEISEKELTLIRYLVNSLSGELEIAYRVTGNACFKEVGILLDTFLSRISPKNIREQLDYLSRAVTVVATSADEAINVLLEKGLLTL